MIRLFVMLTIAALMGCTSAAPAGEPLSNLYRVPTCEPPEPYTTPFGAPQPVVVRKLAGPIYVQSFGQIEALQAPASALTTTAPDASNVASQDAGIQTAPPAGHGTAAEPIRVLHFTMRGCPPCARWEREIFDNDAAWAKVSERYSVCVHDADEPPEPGQKQNMADLYGVHSFPCDVIIDASGKEIGRRNSSVIGGVNVYLAGLDEAVSGASKSRLARQVTDTCSGRRWLFRRR